MSFKVFISSSLKDVRIVKEFEETLRRYGIQPILPIEIVEETLSEWHLFKDALGRRTSRRMYLADKVMQQLKTSDCVLVIVGRSGKRSEFVDFEIGLATAQNKLIIPIVEVGAEIPKTLADKEYILIDRNQPKLSYERAAQYLNKLKIEKERRNAIGGLLLLGLGFLLLAAHARKTTYRNMGVIKRKKKPFEASILIDNPDIKVVEVRYDEKPFFIGVGTSEQREVRVGGAVDLSGVAGEGKYETEKYVKWRFFFNPKVLPEGFMPEERMKNWMAHTVSVVSGSMDVFEPDTQFLVSNNRELVSLESMTSEEKHEKIRDNVNAFLKHKLSLQRKRGKERVD